MKKKHGWVLYGTKTKQYMGGSNLYVDKALRDAKVCCTREKARGFQLLDEAIYKVSLTLKGKAKKVIGRG